MNYWLTVHWPLIEGEEAVSWRNWIFLAEGFESRGRDIMPGDRVVIYETEDSPISRVGGRTIRRRLGRKSVVAIATVVIWMPYKEDEEEILEDGRVRKWSYKAKTDTDLEGEMSLDELRIALCRPGFCARLSGGLMILQKQQFNNILRRFRELNPNQ